MKIKTTRKFSRVLTLLIVSFVFVLAASFAVLSTSNKAQADCSPSTNNGTDTLSFSTPSGVTTTQTYTLWTRILMPSSSGTVQASVDGGTCYSIGGSQTANTFTWVDFANGQTGTPIQVSLAPGAHTLKYYGTTQSSGIDKVLLLTNSCSPVGTSDGAKCETSTPTVSVAASPTTVTQGSAVTLTANVTDSATVTNVVFYDGSTAIGTSQSTVNPYTFNWNTTSSTNTGNHSITARVTDSVNGTTTSPAISVGVNSSTGGGGGGGGGTCSNKPIAPTGVTAKATSATSVSLSWIDALYINGTPGYKAYYVIRNGVNITPSGIGSTSYTDNTVVGGTTYNYQLETLDDSNNVSCPSATASVTTPGSTKAPAPTQPTITAAIPVSSSEIIVTWTKSTSSIGVAGYYVNVNGNRYATVTGTAAGITGLTPSTTYTIHILAVDGNGTTSTASPDVQATTLPASNNVGMIWGVLSNNKTGARIPLAKVQTGPYATAKGTEITYTDANGGFALANILSGTHGFTFSANGYTPKTYSWNIKPTLYVLFPSLTPN